MTDRERKIRERAHQIWEEEGRQHGHAERHWHRAAQEIDRQSDESHESPQSGSAGPAEPASLPDIDTGSTLPPGAATPGERRQAGFGDLGAGRENRTGRASGNRRRAKG